jgi:hypothetical protein
MDRLNSTQNGQIQWVRSGNVWQILKTMSPPQHILTAINRPTSIYWVPFSLTHNSVFPILTSKKSKFLSKKIVSRENLIASKRAAGREVDLEDVRLLEIPMAKKETS